jgi:uncharacterized repeat protein (TIGR01451 family)
MVKERIVPGILVVLVVLLIAPVAACHLEVTTTGEQEVCTSCDFYTYTITVKNVAAGACDTNYLVRVKDILPEGIEFVSYTDNGPVPETASCTNPYPSVLDSGCRIIQWDYTNVPDHAVWDIILNVRPVGKSDGDVVSNLVKARLKHRNGDFLGGQVLSSEVTTFESDLCAAVPTPEFPGMAVPAGLIIGLLGVVLFIKIPKEK